jgi:hypothetical protein
MKFLLLTLFFSLSNSQLVKIDLCSDRDCNKNCISWTATNNECNRCQGINCTITNPSSMVQNMNSLTLYSDDICSNKNIIYQTNKMTLILDSSCHLLYTNDLIVIGSYKAINLSAIIGIIIASIVLFIIIIILIIYSCRKRKSNLQQPTIIPLPIVDYSQGNNNKINQPQPYVIPLYTPQPSAPPQPYVLPLYHPQPSFPIHTNPYPVPIYPQYYPPPIQPVPSAPPA